MERLPKRTMTAEDVDRLVRSPTPLLVQVDRPGAERSLDEFQEFGGALRVVRVAQEDLPGLAHRLKLDCLPSVLLVKGGAVFDRFLGPLPRRLVVARVRAMLEAA
jgi:hypothetical protein